MKQIFPDLWQTEVESPFPGLTTHAYLLTRKQGNVLFYNTGHVHEIDAMAELGGVDWHFLSHLDELGKSLLWVRERYGAKLGGPVREREAFAEILEPDLLFKERETLAGGIEVIPTPGHTPGSTCFLVSSTTGKTYLFTGDTLYRNRVGQWSNGFMDDMSDRDALVASLRLLRDLRPDVVISSAFADQQGYEAMSPSDWAGHVDGALQPLLTNESG
ncbi:MBL fold metallo-hydrolase [Halomonas caseinilytica]|uniref:MBL fold metallo-hydrolase n=1 Tax=Halomonas caseinilytica TaxID=438744 RepID=UPI0007E54F0C|nr:MBL fold metallo-hydrolase [Halomonas caseinilytica]SEN01173.1 Metallo-beta-lactamase superfamily protein [Halomonas caseinilytica]